MVTRQCAAHGNERSGLSLISRGGRAQFDEVQRVLGRQRYRDNAKKLQQAIRLRNAISMAAELIASALKRAAC
jgi:hypothetical protein